MATTIKVNWSAYEALGRTLLILFGSTFFGALVVPMASDGSMPFTVAAWKPVLATALGASIAAEIVWVRSHLQDLAKAVLPTIAAALLFVIACTPQQAQAANNIAIDLTNAVCSVAPDTPIGGPTVEVICAIAQGVEQTVNVEVGASSPTGAATAALNVPVRQIRIVLPAPQAAAFLAAHGGH